VNSSALERAATYRARADEIRKSAEAMSDSDSLSALLRLAEIYERLAAKIEQDGDDPVTPDM
jgi:hypothetical protein